MWWLVTLLILAAIAFFVVKSMKSTTQKQQSEHDLAQQARLDASATTQQSGDVEHATEASAASNTVDKAASSEVDTPSGVAKAAAGTVAAVAAVASAGESGVTAGLSTGDSLSDVREMIKILNLDGPDAGRLQISREQLTALRKGDKAAMPDAASLDEVAVRLRKMLA